jgi:hypothetical protein
MGSSLPAPVSQDSLRTGSTNKVSLNIIEISLVTILLRSDYHLFSGRNRRKEPERK